MMHHSANRLIIMILAILVLALPITAQDEAPPEAARLDGMTLIWQEFNRCSAAAFSIQLSYWGDHAYTEIRDYLNPHEEDVSVRLEEMVSFAEAQGLQGIIRAGGTLDTLKALVAGGFPVLVENAHYGGTNPVYDWMSHNRVVVGYDDTESALYLMDPLLGAGEDGTGRAVDYVEFDDLWLHFNRGYLVIYDPEDEADVQAILGEDWDRQANLERALVQAEAELEAEPTDVIALFNRGTLLSALGRHEAAAADFDQAREMALPWRMLWYRFEPFESYMALERYDDVLALSETVFAATPGVEEAYYYAGLANLERGSTDRARRNLSSAVWRNTNFDAAVTALESITEE